MNMTDDPGVKDMLRFLITRDHMHQMQGLAAMQELQDDGLEGIPVPEAFPLEVAAGELGYTLVVAPDGEQAAAGRWASGVAPDGSGRNFTAAAIEATADAPVLPPGDPRLYPTPQTEATGFLQKAKDMLT